MLTKTQKTNNTSTNHVHAITSYGIKAVTGNRDFALFGAVATQLCNTKEDPNYQVLAPDGQNTDPAIVAPLQQFSASDEEIELHIRILLSVSDVLRQATENIPPSTIANNKYLFLIITPATVYTRSHVINNQNWTESVKQEFSAFNHAQFHFLPADNNVTKNLQKALAEIDAGKFDTVVLAGCDSLANEQTCLELLQHRKLCSNKMPDGIIPGEAAACVVIEKVDPAITPILAIISSLAFADEPNCGQAHLKKLDGLHEAITTALNQAGVTPEQLDCVIRNSTTEPHYVLEWYQVSQRLWRNTLTEQQRLEYQQGELDEPPQLDAPKQPEPLLTSITMGEVGAASIPLNLVLGCARFNFNYPTVNNCLICEANEFPFRGVILLGNPQGNTGSKTNKPAHRKKR